MRVIFSGSQAVCGLGGKLCGFNKVTAERSAKPGRDLRHGRRRSIGPRLNPLTIWCCSRAVGAPEDHGVPEGRHLALLQIDVCVGEEMSGESDVCQPAGRKPATLVCIGQASSTVAKVVIRVYRPMRAK